MEHFHLDENGRITISELNYFVLNHDLMTLNLEEALEYLKMHKIELPKNNGIELEIEKEKKHNYIRKSILNCVMYRIIERGGNRIGPRRGLMFAKEFNADIIVFEEAQTMKEDVKSLIQLTRELKKRGKLFIFVTHICKNISRLWHKDPNIPLYSRYRKAIPYFDATVIIDRDIFNDNDTEKIRLFEKRERKCRSIPIHFDFPKQKVTYK